MPDIELASYSIIPLRVKELSEICYDLFSAGPNTKTVLACGKVNPDDVKLVHIPVFI
jgi:hypothetical protein